MADPCAKCGCETAADFAFCPECGTPVGSIPVVLKYDKARAYFEDVETTIDLVIENVGSEPLRDLAVDVAGLSRTLAVAPGARAEVCLAGFRPPEKTEAMVLPVSVGGPVSLAGEFKVRVRRRKARSVEIVGNNNIVDMARIGAPVGRRAGPEWAAVPLRVEERIDLLVRDPDGERTFDPRKPVSFGRRKETNQVVVRVRGDDRKAVDRISRNHLNVFLREGGFVVRDTSSKGTLVNGKRVSEAALREGDVVSLGGAAEFRFAVERAGGRIRRAILERIR